MVTDILIRILFWFLIAVLIYNLTQRKYMEYGVRKRFASLGLAGLTVVCILVLLLFRRYGFPDLVSPAAIIIFILLGYLMRERVFPYKRKCISCGRRLPLRHILYFDSLQCYECDYPEKKISEPEPVRPQRKLIIPVDVDEIDWENWKYEEEAVLCFVIFDGRILLIHKKTGLGAGKVNGPGGRIEPGETPEDAAVRESEEEIGITPKNLSCAGILHFIFTDGYSLKGYVFKTAEFSGELKETREAAPFWCGLDDIPFGGMWADDAVWFPHMLNDEYFHGFFIFKDDDMLSHRVILLDKNRKRE